MTDYEIPSPTVRVCTATGRELKPGDRVFGVLLDEGGKLTRRDYAAEAWPGPPTGAVAYWSGRVPTSDKPRKPVYNEGLLFDCFDHLATATEPEKLNFRYVVALLLMRRKRLKFEDTRRSAAGDVMVLRDARTGSRVEVTDPRLGDEQIVEAQNEVFRVLGWE
jgi:hypothetical protein